MMPFRRVVGHQRGIKFGYSGLGPSRKAKKPRWKPMEYAVTVWDTGISINQTKARIMRWRMIKSLTAIALKLDGWRDIIFSPEGKQE